MQGNTQLRACLIPQLPELTIDVSEWRVGLQLLLSIVGGRRRCT
jgi:hypothetical protein